MSALRGPLDVEVDETFMAGLQRMMKKSVMSKIVCVEHCVVEDWVYNEAKDTEIGVGRDFKYIVVTDDQFFVLARSDVVRRGKVPRRAVTHIKLSDVDSVEVPSAGPDMFNDPKIDKRSMQVIVRFKLTDKEEDPGRCNIRIATFAKQARVAFYLRRMWLKAMRRMVTRLNTRFTYRMAIGLDQEKRGGTLKTRMRGAALAIRAVGDAQTDETLSDTAEAAQGTGDDAMASTESSSEPEPEPEPTSTVSGAGDGGGVAESVVVVKGTLGGRRPSLPVALPLAETKMAPLLTAIQKARIKFAELESDLVGRDTNYSNYGPPQDDYDSDEARDGVGELWKPLSHRFDLVEELSTSCRFYRNVQQCFWESTNIFRFLVDELNEYAWLSVSRKPGPARKERMGENLQSRLKYLVVLLEAMQHAFACEIPERVQFLIPTQRITMMAELMWLLGGCAEVKSAARLDLMYDHLTDRDDHEAQDNDDTISIAESVAASTLAPVDEDEEAAALRLEQEAAEEEQVLQELSPKDSEEQSELNPLLGYVVDLVSTLFVEIEDLAEQARAFGGTRFHRNMFSKMILNVQDEWIPKVSKILLRIVELVNFQTEVAMDGLGRTMSVFTQTQQEPTKKQMEWCPSAVMDMQIFNLCRTLHFLVVKVGDPVFAYAIRDDSSLQTLFQLDLEFNSPTGQQFLDRIHFDGEENPPEPEPEPEDEGEGGEKEPVLQPKPKTIPLPLRPDVPRADFYNEQSREYIEEIVAIVNSHRQ